MTSTLTATLNPKVTRPSVAITQAAPAVALLILTERLFGELQAELGSFDSAMQFLTATVTTSGRPIGVTFEKAVGGARTCFMSPRGWTDERLRGWVAGHHQAIEELFGPSEPVRVEDL